MKPTTLIAPKTDIEFSAYIVKTIASQLQHPSVLAFLSWGATNFQHAESEDKKEPVPRFKVNGMKHQGYVNVIYNASDYYDIEFCSYTDEMLERYEDIDCENLQRVIDEYVERLPEYVR